MSGTSDRHETPEWADEQLSRELPVLRARGEGQHLEYMRCFPEQVRDLGKEIAAFATSGGGLILIGVDDEGNLVDLEGAERLSKRDHYLERIEGIAHGTVDPPITPKVGFACEGKSVVLFIRIHKGNQPVYYCAQRPYVRHLTESRPARPEEVIARVLSWGGLVQSDEGIQEDETSERYWKSELDAILVGFLMAMDEMPRLSLDPGPDYLQSVCDSTRSRLRELVVEYLEDEDAVAVSLEGMACKCDEIVWTLTSRHSGTWPMLQKQCPAVRELANELRDSLIGGSVVAHGFEEEAAKSIKAAGRRVRALLERFDQMLGTYGQDDLLGEAGGISEPVLRLTYDPLPFLSDEDIEELRRAAMDLHVLAYHGQYYSGSGSDRPLRERLAKQVDKIEAIAAKID